MISEEKYIKLYNLFLLLIASTIIFRKLNTILILVFVGFNLFFYKKLDLDKKSLIAVSVIALPLIIHIIFFWNDNFNDGIKQVEKYLSTLVFPLFIIGNRKRINFYIVVNYYAIITTFIVLFFFIRFNIFNQNLMQKYLSGIDLIEMGYQFSKTMGIHAPALNMHLAFVSIIIFNLLLNSFLSITKNLLRVYYFLLFILSFFFILFVNTRIALLCVLIGYLIIISYKCLKSNNRKKVIKTGIISFFSLIIIGVIFVKNNPYMSEKYGSVTFNYMDKIGKLDEIENPEIKVFNSFVTRLSIWKSAWELSSENLLLGVGSSKAKPELVNYFKGTNQVFLAKYEFSVHNQYLDFLLRFGIIGLVVVIIYIGNIGYIGLKAKTPIILSFFTLFFISNLTDDYLIKFDGIAFSSFWISLFYCFYFETTNK